MIPHSCEKSLYHEWLRIYQSLTIIVSVDQIPRYQIVNNLYFKISHDDHKSSPNAPDIFKMIFLPYSRFIYLFFFPEKYIDPQYFSNLVHRHLKKLSSVNKRLWKNGTHPLYIMFRIFETYGSIVTISFVLFPAFLSSHSSLISFASSRLRTHAFLLQNANSKDPIIA